MGAINTIKQPLKWHGGKHYLAKHIVEMMPSHTKYLEPFAGGLSVLLRKPYEGVAEWICDTHLELTNFWQVLRDETLFSRFRMAVEATPLSEIEFEISSMEPLYSDPVDRAWAFFIRARQSRQGLGRDYCTPTSRTRRGMNEQVSAWLSAVDGLPGVHERLRRVEIWNRPAVKAIQKLDSEDLLVYADPPYVWSTRKTIGEYGDHEMNNGQHLELLKVLASMRGRFLLSGYRNDMYDNFADSHGWRLTEIEIPNHASGAKTKERKYECIWSNF